MTKFSCFITGEDHNLLRSDTPKSKQKVAALTTALFVPVAFWFISTFLLTYHVLGEPLWIALSAGLISSFFIFLIERIIIMSNGSKAMIIFRVLVGFVIAALGSLSIDEVLFKADVDQQLVVLEQEKVNAELEVIDLKSDDKLTRMNQQIDQKYEQWQTAVGKVQSEADGSSGSGHSGVGDITKLKQQHANNAEGDYQAAQSELINLQNQIAADKQGAKTKIEESFSQHALLHRIQALFDLILTNNYMLTAYIFFTVLFLAMEFLVVFLKVALPKTNYERRKDAMEVVGERRINRLISHDELVYQPDQANPKVKKANRVLEGISTNSILF